MAKLLQAGDALNQAIDSNNGLEALASLMTSAREADAPDLKSLAELVCCVQKDIASHLDDVRRYLDS